MPIDRNPTEDNILNDIAELARRFRLAEAAADLLASCEALVRQIVETSAYDDARRGEDPGLWADVEAARTAIAKATGQ